MTTKEQGAAGPGRVAPVSRASIVTSPGATSARSHGRSCATRNPHPEGQSEQSNHRLSRPTQPRMVDDPLDRDKTGGCLSPYPLVSSVLLEVLLPPVSHRSQGARLDLVFRSFLGPHHPLLPYFSFSFPSDLCHIPGNPSPLTTITASLSIALLRLDRETTLSSCFLYLTARRTRIILTSRPT